MGFYGADIQQLKDLAGTLNKDADRLDFEIVKALSWTLFSSPWDGVDAIEFRAQWTRQIVPALAAAAGTLREAATRLSRNSDEQEKASDAATGSIVSSSGRVPAPDGGRGKGKKTKVNPEGFTEPRGGKYGLDRDMMDLSFASYDHTVGEGHTGLIPGGWREVSSKELREMGISPDALGMQGLSFSSTLYRNVDGKYVLAFAGSDDAGDWINNGAGTVGASPEGMYASRLAVYLKENLESNGVDGNELSFTGHSLGGNLASYASIATGSSAATFNAAGLSTEGFNFANGLRKSTCGRSVSWSEASESVTAYTATGDPLTILQDGTDIPKAFGARKYLETKSGDPSSYVVTGGIGQGSFDHMKVPISGAFDKMVSEQGEYYH